MSFYNRIVKRMLDIICSLAALVCLSVLYLPICAIIKCTSEGPVFFRQKRIGKNKKYFNILKFRTMRIDTPKDCPTHLLKNPEQYITKVGAFLRKTSLDELPQIFNIFKGDMSVIGPRPALWNQDDLISERDEYGINDLKPGLTGWAQINGRDELPIPEKVQMDKIYRDNVSFVFDVKCLFMTVASVFKHDGVVGATVVLLFIWLVPKILMCFSLPYIDTQYFVAYFIGYYISKFNVKNNKWTFWLLGLFMFAVAIVIR